MSLTRAGNPLKDALRRGETHVGCWLAMDSPVAAELVALAGFDWALIDGEHGAGGEAGMLAQLRALDGTGCAAAVRVAAADPALIARALDLGARSLMVPRIESVAQAEAVAAAALYPPAGRRGTGGSVVRAAGYGARSGLIHEANDELLLILQLESRAALDALDGIAAVPGVGALFIGPADLAADMGHPGEPAHPEVRAAIEDAIARIRAVGLAAGIVDDAAESARWRAAGVTLLAVATDVLVLSGGLRAALDGA